MTGSAFGFLRPLYLVGKLYLNLPAGIRSGMNTTQHPQGYAKHLSFDDLEQKRPFEIIRVKFNWTACHLA